MSRASSSDKRTQGQLEIGLDTRGAQYGRQTIRPANLTMDPADDVHDGKEVTRQDELAFLPRIGQEVAQRCGRHCASTDRRGDPPQTVELAPKLGNEFLKVAGGIALGQRGRADADI